MSPGRASFAIVAVLAPTADLVTQLFHDSLDVAS
jgi:hypothetical protein